MDNKRIFIVHGRDTKMLSEVEAFVKEIGYEPIVLYKEPSRGNTIIEKFEKMGSEASYAIALFSPDDKGGLIECKGKRTKYRFRARQNVVFEYGYFFAKIGRDHVCALVKGEMENPSDYDGVVYIGYDENGQWKKQVEREINAVDNTSHTGESIKSDVELMLQQGWDNHHRVLMVSVINKGDRNIIVREIGIHTQSGQKLNYSKADGCNKVPRSIRAGEVSDFHLDTTKVFTCLDVSAYVYAELANGSVVKSVNLTQEDIDWHGARHLQRRKVYVG